MHEADDHTGHGRHGAADTQSHKGASQHNHENHQGHHAAMIADFRRRFLVSLLLTLPILALSPMLQSFAGVDETLAFPGDRYLLFLLATLVFVYGGWPFLQGLSEELGKREPGMMTLIALAISVAWAYSSAVVFGLQGKIFFWELATGGHGPVGCIGSTVYRCGGGAAVSRSDCGVPATGLCQLACLPGSDRALTHNFVSISL